MSRRTAELKEEEPNQVRLLNLEVVTGITKLQS